MANPQTFYTVVASAKETTWGTSVARTVFHPSEEPRFQPQALRHIVDEGYRGLSSSQFDLIPGPGEGTVQFDGNYYIDTSTHWLVALLGLDTVSGAADPYTHTITQTATPPSYSLEWQQNVQSYLFAGARLGQVKLTFSGQDGALRYSASGMSKLGTTTTATTTSFGTTTSISGWMGTVTVAGSGPSATLIEGELTLSRQLKPIHGLIGSQDVAALYPGCIMVEGRLTFDFPDTNVYNYYASSSPAKNIVVLTFTQVATTRTVTLTMSKVGWRVVDIERNDQLYQAVAQVNGLYNTTDSGSLGVVVKNGQATAY